MIALLCTNRFTSGQKSQKQHVTPPFTNTDRLPLRMQTPLAPFTDACRHACRQQAWSARDRVVDQFEHLNSLPVGQTALFFLLLLPRVCFDMPGERLGVDIFFALRTSLFRIGPLLAFRVAPTMKPRMFVKERAIELLLAVGTCASQF